MQTARMMSAMTAMPANVTGSRSAALPLRSPLRNSPLAFSASPMAQRATKRTMMVVEARASSTRDRAVKGAKRVAEGDAYGSNSGGGNSSAYLAQAIVSAGVAGLFALAPETASDLLFNNGGGAYQSILFRILSLGFLSAGVVNWTQNAAAKADVLDDVVHRRADASLSFFAAANLFLTAITFIPNPALYPSSPLTTFGAVGAGAISAFQWWVSGRNYAKYSPEGANPGAILKSYGRDLSELTEVDGLNSGIYAFLTLAFVGAGFAYIFAPAQTLDLAFGTQAPKTTADIFLWQLAGAGVSTVVGPIAITQKEAALENNFSRPDKRALMAGLASASIAHTLILLPLLNSPTSGPATVPLLGTWALSALASTFIAIKPSE